MRKSPAVIVIAALVAIAACQPQTQPATTLAVPRERANECVSVCYQLGMRMTAMVVIMNGAGCVCEPEPQAPNTPGAPGAAASGASGGAVIAAAAAAAQADAAERQRQQQAADAARRQQQQQQQQQQHH